MAPRPYPFRVTLHGSAHARIVNGKIVHHREFYDPIGSVANRFAFVGKAYRKFLEFSS
jgi:hypothetical protein